MNTSWKITVAYYILAGITAEEKANIVLSCLEELYKTGINIKHVRLMVLRLILQCQMFWEQSDSTQIDIKPSFELPSSKENIHIILDTRHIVQLVKNT